MGMRLSSVAVSKGIHFAILLHILWWFLVFLLLHIAIANTYYPIVHFEGNFFQKWWALVSTFLVAISSFYGTFFISKRYGSPIQRPVRFVFIGLLVLALSIAYFYTLIYLYYEGDLSLYFIPWRMPFRTPPYLAILPAGIFAIPGLAFQSYHQLKKQQESELKLQNEKLKLELELIKSRLNPHFLFNVLNIVEHLIRKSPEKASASLIKLSSLLRYQVYDTAKRKVKMGKEIEIVEAYLSLQCLRLKNVELLAFKKDVKNPSILVESAVFLPFIENAFKHANLNEQIAFIDITLVSSTDHIIFSIKNSKVSPEVEDQQQGVGLELIRKRLELCYPNAHSLKVRDDGESFEVSLNIDLK